MVVVNDCFTSYQKERGCTAVACRDKVAIGWLNVDSVVVLSVLMAMVEKMMIALIGNQTKGY